MLTSFYITVFIFEYDCAVFRFIPPSVTDFIRNIIKEVSEHRTSDKVTRNDLFNHFMKKTAGLCLLQNSRNITRYLSYYLFLTIMSIFVHISSKCPFSVSGGEAYVFDFLNALPSVSITQFS